MPVYLPARSVLRAAGDDAGPFLDALVTNDVSAADGERSVYAALLSPQGKVITDMIAHRAPDGALLLDIPRERAADLLRRLTMYRLRRRIDLDDVTATLAVVVRTHGQSSRTPDPRSPDGAFGARFIAASPPTDPDPLTDYETLRIAAGVPDPAVDAGVEEVFALEALLEELHGVDFQKGCFIGQENVSRMKRRATTRKKFCRVVFEGPVPARGTPVIAGPATLGDVRSGVQGRAIALLRLDRALEAREAGTPIMAGQTVLRLDPPDWLILPEKGDT